MIDLLFWIAMAACVLELLLTLIEACYLARTSPETTDAE